MSVMGAYAMGFHGSPCSILLHPLPPFTTSPSPQSTTTHHAHIATTKTTMAASATTFHLSTPLSHLHPLTPKPHCHTTPSFLHLPKRPFLNSKKFTVKSIDISKEDTTPPTSENTSPDPPSPSLSEDSDTFDKRRLEEKFAVLNTGIYECRSCGYKYDEAVGDPSYPIPPGFQFEKLPDDWRCPTCGAAQSFFQSKSVEIAGFAQNQQFGLGGNSLTSGQKALLIYGTLFFFFALFLSGYFLQ